MVQRGSPLPARIEPDAIIEALVEVRFDIVSPLPEVLFGRLAEIPDWKGFTQRSLPAYGIPAAFRDMEPNLRYVPVFELAGTAPARQIRIGAHVLSYHRLPPYPGWNVFSAELAVAIDGLFGKSEGLIVNRIGMRYINALTPDAHGIRTVDDLDLALSVSQATVRGKFNLNVSLDAVEQSQTMVRIATPEFVQGTFPADTSFVVDVDIFTPAEYRADSSAVVKDWIAEARGKKNSAFLGLLPAATLARLGRDR